MKLDSKHRDVGFPPLSYGARLTRLLSLRGRNLTLTPTDGASGWLFFSAVAAFT